ncbi:MAG: ParA family protein [Sporichthyaceae bacterium]
MFVVTVLSLKGGVGKTTTTIGLAGAAATHGLRTLVVDLDPQANATLALDVAPGEITAAEVFDDPSPDVVDLAIRPSGWTAELTTPANRPVALDVLLGHAGLLRHDIPDVAPGRLFHLARALTHVAGDYDLVLVDCPPNLARLTRSALVASDRALVVTEPSFFAVHGADRAFRAVQEERTHNPTLQPLGVVVNRYDARMVEHRFRYEELCDLFGPLVLQPPLPDRIVLAQAQGMGLPVQRWRTQASRDACAAFEAYLARLLRTADRGGHRTDRTSAGAAAG